MKKYISIISLLLLSACVAAPITTEQNVKPELTLTPVSFSNLTGWSQENFDGFAEAFQKSCARIAKAAPSKKFGSDMRWGVYGDYQTICQSFADQKPNDMRQFFETHFTPYQVADRQNTQGMFTGYYESALNGARTRQGIYQTPLRARPDDLVMVDLGAFREELKGQRIAGRVQGGNLKPYETHAQINAGKLPAPQDKPLVWVDDPVAAFFVQIQGSGLVTLNDGTYMRIGYDGQNGHPYYAVGKELVKRGVMAKEDVSMQSITAWLKANPAEAQSFMETNPSYVFFRELNGQNPVGGEGVELTPLRSLAVDHSLLPYGLPVWLAADHPMNGAAPLNRLMMAQDTGGAIRGAVRGDVFWGHGVEPEKNAGVMKSTGRYWALIPKTVKP